MYIDFICGHNPVAGVVNYHPAVQQLSNENLVRIKR